MWPLWGQRMRTSCQHWAHPQLSEIEGWLHFSMEQHGTVTDNHLGKVMPRFATLGNIPSFFGTHTKNCYTVLANVHLVTQVLLRPSVSLVSWCYDLTKATWGRKGLFQATVPHCREVKAGSWIRWSHHIHNPEPRSVQLTFSTLIKSRVPGLENGGALLRCVFPHQLT